MKLSPARSCPQPWRGYLCWGNQRSGTVHWSPESRINKTEIAVQLYSHLLCLGIKAASSSPINKPSYRELVIGRKLLCSLVDAEGIHWLRGMW